MKYLHYGFLSIIKKPLFNLLIIIELAGIFIVGNLAIAASNSRMVYYEPFSEIIHSSGYIVEPGGAFFTEYDRNKTVKKTYDSLEKVKVITNYNCSKLSNLKKFYKISDPREFYSKTIYAFDNSIYSKFNLPLASGRWASCTKNSKGQVEAVVLVNSDTVELGDVVPFYNTEDEKAFDIVIVGIIENNDLVPDVIFPMNEDFGIDRHYNTQMSSGDSMYFVASGADESLTDEGEMGHSCSYMIYTEAPDEKVEKENLEKLKTLDCMTLKLSTLRENSDKYLFEQFIKIMPVLLGVFLIVLVELICSVTMNTRNQMRNYGIYYLCGCRWKDIVKISAANSAIILSFGAIIGAVGVVLFEFTPYASLFEQNLDFNNIYLTLLIVLIMLIMSLIIPAFMLKRTQPVEIIKEN